MWHRGTSGSSSKSKWPEFGSIQDVEAARTAQLVSLMKEGFPSCPQRWQEGWGQYVQSEGQDFAVDYCQWVFYCNDFFKTSNIHCVLCSYLLLCVYAGWGKQSKMWLRLTKPRLSFAARTSDLSSNCSLITLVSSVCGNQFPCTGWAQDSRF